MNYEDQSRTAPTDSSNRTASHMVHNRTNPTAIRTTGQLQHGAQQDSLNQVFFRGLYVHVLTVVHKTSFTNMSVSLPKISVVHVGNTNKKCSNANARCGRKTSAQSGLVVNRALGPTNGTYLRQLCFGMGTWQIRLCEINTI